MPLPRTVGADAVCAARLAAGARVLEFDDLVLDWSDVRRLCGQAADLLRRADFLEPDVEARALACLRDAQALPTELRRWFDRDATADAGAAQVWTFGLRPYLTRAAAALLPRLAAGEWQRATLPRVRRRSRSSPRGAAAIAGSSAADAPRSGRSIRRGVRTAWTRTRRRDRAFRIRAACIASKRARSAAVT